MAGVLGIERMVLVQPTFYGTDNRLLAEVLRRLGPRARGVIRIEEATSDADLDRFHDLGVRAIRLDLFARRSWPAADIIGYVRRMAARAAPRGWHIQFYTPGTVLRDLLPFLADLEDPFVIDHMGYMLEADGLTQADFDPPARGAGAWAAAGSSCPGRTGSPNPGRSAPSGRWAARWCPPGPTG